MKSVITKLSLIACLVFAVCLVAKPAQAATVKTLGTSGKTATYKADMSHDGKADRIKIALTQKNGYITKTTVYINDKKKAVADNLFSYNVTAQYVKLSNAKEFLYLIGRGDSGMPDIQKVYYYNTKTKKLEVALDLDQYTSAAGGIRSATNDSIKVSYSCGPATVGRIKWNYVYKYNSKTHKFKLNSPTVTVKNNFTYDPKDGLTKAFKESKYKTDKSVTFCSDKACTTESFTVPENKWVQMKKIYVTPEGRMAIQFVYGSKTGWLLVKDPTTYVSPNFGSFQGINNRLAGGFFG